MSHETELRAVRGLTRVLDRMYVDPILGFFLPGVGDVVTGAAGIYAVALAARMRIGKATVARMLVNLAVDLAIGAIPIVGDAFDVWFKAHERNLALLERRVAAPAPSSARDGLYVAGAALLFLAALALPVLVVIWALRQI